MTKAELRAKYLTLRNSLTEKEYQASNEKLFVNFFSHIDLSAVRLLHTFLPIPDKREPDTKKIIGRLENDFPGIKISIPRVRIESNELESVLFATGDPLVSNAWGIPEPFNNTIVPPGTIDLVIVPLLAFDRRGNRVGYGKGFYDKFLATCRKDVLKVGLSAFDAEPLIENLASFDIALDLCITSKKAYRFSN